MSTVFKRVSVLKRSFVIVGCIALIPLVFILLRFISPPFSVENSTVLESREGRLMGARIASDGQWRFPSPDSIPVRFQQCLLAFEDRFFYFHPGINPFSLGRALFQNVRAGHTVSGGSTITMQVARLSRPGKKRNLYNKLVEMVLAVHFELRFPKDEILKMYVSQAPFGGNVVGLEAASWRYYQRPPHQLSWGESATLAVLPNSPSLIYPGRNDDFLLRKRNRLLDLLCSMGKLDSLTVKLSKAEPLPGKIHSIPDISYHLTEVSRSEHSGKRMRSTLDFHLQEQVNEAVVQHAKGLRANHVYNACALVADVRTGKVLAYVGNLPPQSETGHGNHVDIIRAPRSSGSILKPFLYAAMMDKGLITPRQLIPDIPTRFEGFTPLNFSHDYDGAVPAAEALARSLNVPAVKMLQTFGVESFYHFLEKTGMSTLTKPPGHYGLSLVLGGAETTLYDLAGMYASLARSVLTYEERDGFYPVEQFKPLRWKDEAEEREAEASSPFLKAASAFLTLEALREVNRPEEETGWEAFASARHIAWKTGTSFGFRDAWSVGVTRNYVVAVWAGNADGEGRAGLTGTLAASPLMFAIFDMLPREPWFSEPAGEMIPQICCRQSGYLPSRFCTDLDTVRVPGRIQTGQCPFHHQVYLDRQRRFRVNSDCCPVADLQAETWFVLPPAMEHYYRRKHPGYAVLPAWNPGCYATETAMEMIYPREMEYLFIPRQLGNVPGMAIFEIAHRNPSSEVFWYLDKEYLGATAEFHQMSLHPSPGWHLLTLIDREGNQLQKRFFVVDSS